MPFALLLERIAWHIERSLVGWRAPRYYGSNTHGQSTIINAVTKLRSRYVTHRPAARASVLSSRAVPSRRRLARATAPARAIALNRIENRSLVRSFLIVDCTCVPDCRCRGARRPILMQNKPAKPPRPVRPRSSFAEMSAGEQHSPMLFALLLACHIERSLVGWRAPRYYGSNTCGQSTIINEVTKLRSRNVAHRCARVPASRAAERRGVRRAARPLRRELSL